MHTDPLDLIAKVTDFAKHANLDTDFIHFQEQINDSVIDKVRQWLKVGKAPEKDYTIKSKTLQAYRNNFNLLIIESKWFTLLF